MEYLITSESIEIFALAIIILSFWDILTTKMFGEERKARINLPGYKKYYLGFDFIIEKGSILIYYIVGLLIIANIIFSYCKSKKYLCDMNERMMVDQIFFALLILLSGIILAFVIICKKTIQKNFNNNKIINGEPKVS